MQKKRDFAVNLLLYAIFAFYLALLALILFRQHHSARSFNLIPLRGIISYLTGVDLVSGTADPALLRGFALSNLLGNIVIFIPLGLFLTLLNRKKEIWRNTLWVAGASAAAEAIQFTFLLGIADIDDVILNTLGGLAGVLLCRWLYRLCKNDEQKTRLAAALLVPAAGAVGLAILILQNGN